VLYEIKTWQALPILDVESNKTPVLNSLQMQLSFPFT